MQVLNRWPAGSSGGRAAIITSRSSVGLLPPSSAPCRMSVHASRMLGVSSSTSLFLSSVKGNSAVSTRLRIALALSNTW